METPADAHSPLQAPRLYSRLRSVKLTRAEFVVSAYAQGQFPPRGIPEVVFAGRSNVGKSSLINALVGHKQLARTSRSPGKTQSINFYRVNDAFYLVDLPGYGFARVGHGERMKWKRLIEGYFESRSTIALLVHLVDSRMSPKKMDLELAQWLGPREIPRMVVATKADKLSGNERAPQARRISSALGDEPVILCSSRNHTGFKEIWHRLEEAVLRN